VNFILEQISNALGEKVGLDDFAAAASAPGPSAPPPEAEEESALAAALGGLNLGAIGGDLGSILGGGGGGMTTLASLGSLIPALLE
jgi:succinyl-CoA synthetase beta subunit